MREIMMDQSDGGLNLGPLNLLRATHWDIWPGIWTDLTVTHQRLVYHTTSKSNNSPRVTFSGNHYPLSDLEQLGFQFEQTQYHEPETKSKSLHKDLKNMKSNDNTVLPLHFKKLSICHTFFTHCMCDLSDIPFFLYSLADHQFSLSMILGISFF